MLIVQNKFPIKYNTKEIKKSNRTFFISYKLNDF